MQVSLLSKKGIKACGVYGGQDDEQVQKDVLKGEYRLVYFTPETIIGVKKWRNMLLNDVNSSRLRTFIIDEAHTVKCKLKWPKFQLIYLFIYNNINY